MRTGLKQINKKQNQRAQSDGEDREDSAVVVHRGKRWSTGLGASLGKASLWTGRIYQDEGELRQKLNLADRADSVMCPESIF